MSEQLIRGLAGDWHGNTRWAVSVIRTFGEYGVKRIYQLGDFGVWGGTGGEFFLRNVEEACNEVGIEVWVTPGNHENYKMINAVAVGRDGLQWIRPHIGLIPRGHRWLDGERTFVSLGGAPSIDFQQRTRNKSWWSEEMITLEEAAKVAADGHADVMLAHDAPDGCAPAVQAIIDTPPHLSMWSDAGLRYAREGRQLMNLAVAGVKPKLFLHGHYHVHDDDGPQPEGVTRHICLDMDGTRNNVAMLELPSLRVAHPGERFE